MIGPADPRPSRLSEYSVSVLRTNSSGWNSRRPGDGMIHSAIFRFVRHAAICCAVP